MAGAVVVGAIVAGAGDGGRRIGSCDIGEASACVNIVLVIGEGICAGAAGMHPIDIDESEGTWSDEIMPSPDDEMRSRDEIMDSHEDEMRSRDESMASPDDASCATIRMARDRISSALGCAAAAASAVAPSDVTLSAVTSTIAVASAVASSATPASSTAPAFAVGSKATGTEGGCSRSASPARTNWCTNGSGARRCRAQIVAGTG